MDPSRVCDRYIRYIRYTAPRALHGMSMWDGHRGAQQRHSDPSRGAHGRSQDFLRHTQFIRDPDRCLMRSPCKNPSVGHLSIRLHGRHGRRPSQALVTWCGAMSWSDSRATTTVRDADTMPVLSPTASGVGSRPTRSQTSWLHTGAPRGVTLVKKFFFCVLFFTDANNPLNFTDAYQFPLTITT